MKKITFDHPHHRKHFEFFRNMNHPHFNICVNVDITHFLTILKHHELKFYPSMVYAISRIANEIPQFRWRIRGEEVIEHPTIRPSFAVSTDAADVFSFCEVAYTPDYHGFVREALAKMEAMRSNPSLEDEEGQDDYLFLSTFPWASFTGFQHAMPYHPTDSVPRMVWGKYFEENGKVKIPLSVQVHHALVDGRHVGAYFQQLEAFFNDFKMVL